MNASLSKLPDISPPYTVFLADLHLSEDTPEMNQAFSLLLSSDLFKKAEAFYLLGDLFAFWGGDDALTEPVYAAIAKDILQLSRKGVRCYFQRGNRDFLVRDTFGKTAGMKIIADPYLVDLYGKKTLLSHGDLFCTNDATYQRFRKQTRGRLKEDVFLLLPKKARQVIIDYTRSALSQKNHKNRAGMDVDEMTVGTFAAQYAATQVIHGHTHLPAIHSEPYGCRYVISDWRIEDNQVTAGVLIASPDHIDNYLFSMDLSL